MSEPAVPFQPTSVEIHSAPPRAKPEPRCGPWDEQPDGSVKCRKCGDIDVQGVGPLGF